MATDPLVKAYARLKGLHGNVPNAPFTSMDLVQEFNRALDDLKLAGYDLVTEFALTNEGFERDWMGTLVVRTALLRARIEAVLTCFEIDYSSGGDGQGKTRIGFEAPQP